MTEREEYGSESGGGYGQESGGGYGRESDDPGSGGSFDDPSRQ